jgi:hypothetical protein
VAGCSGCIVTLTWMPPLSLHLYGLRRENEPMKESRGRGNKPPDSYRLVFASEVSFQLPGIIY